MAIAPQWLNPEQIERRLDVLRTVEWLLRSSSISDRTSKAQRFNGAVMTTALKAVRQAGVALRSAADQAEKAGAAPVDHEVLDLVRTFNSIGPVRLKELYQSRHRSSSSSDKEHGSEK